MSQSIDLDGYFSRVGWDGGAAPTYETLAGVLNAHVDSIPFENFDVLLGRPPRLDLENLQAKLVHARRGGYCFEQATLLAAALEAMGFSVQRCSARVVLFEPASELPRAHMYLIVTLDGARYIVDPGFGMWGTKAPAPIDEAGRGPGAPTHRMTSDDGLMTAWVMREGTEVAGWVSPGTADQPIDFEVANHYTATHPQSPFLNVILASASRKGSRTNLMNADATLLSPDAVEKLTLPDRRALRELVARDFGFDLPELETIKVPSVPEWR